VNDCTFAAGGTGEGAVGRRLPGGGTATGVPTASGRPRLISVLVVDDSRVFRRGMVRAVEMCADMLLVGEADGGEAAVEAIGRLRPEVVLLDLRMPGLDGMGVLARLRESGALPDTCVVLVSATLDEDVEREALAAGAAACMSKATARADICAAALRLVRQ
jgi:DNA-binding NarL/FixJ family response regulator